MLFRSFENHLALILTIAIPLITLFTNLFRLYYNHEKIIAKVNSKLDFPLYKSLGFIAVLTLVIYAAYSGKSGYSLLCILIPFLINIPKDFILRLNSSKITETGIFLQDGFHKWSSFSNYHWSSPTLLKFKSADNELELNVDDDKKLEMDLILNQYIDLGQTCNKILYKEADYNNYTKSN